MRPVKHDTNIARQNEDSPSGKTVPVNGGHSTKPHSGIGHWLVDSYVDTNVCRRVENSAVHAFRKDNQNEVKSWTRHDEQST